MQDRVSRIPLPSTDRRLERVRSLARLLDSAVHIPGTGIRFGADSILGLVPGLGDIAGAALSGYMILLGSRMGLSRATLTRMLANVAIDTIGGSVPVLGDLFDVAFKANMKNLALLEQTVADRDSTTARRPANKLLLVGALLLLVLLIIGSIALSILAVQWIVRSMK